MKDTKKKVNSFMKFTVCISAFFFLFISCGQQNENDILLKRKDRLSEKEMIEVLCEVHLLEESTKRINLRESEKGQFASYHYEKLFEKYDINKELFDKNLKYYQQDLEKFDELYEKVIEKLSSLQENKQQQTDK